MRDKHHAFIHALTLFTSFSTLICCALPALLVALGAGAALAGIVSSAPQLIWLSEYKIAVFMTAGGLLAISGLLHYRSRHAPCPADVKKAKTCKTLRKTSKIIYPASLALYAIGFVFAFIAPYWIG